MEFYRIPKQVLNTLSPRESILLTLLMDRHELSVRNNYTDGNGIPVVCYAVKDVCEVLGCSRPTATKAFHSLADKGFIRIVRRGLNRPNAIYVTANFFESGCKVVLQSEVKNVSVKREKEFTSGGKKPLHLDVKKVSPNKTNISHTKKNHTEITIPNEFTANFEVWWRAYPRVGCEDVRDMAYAEYAAAVKNGTSPSDILDALYIYRQEAEKKQTKQTYLYMPHNFLRYKLAHYIALAKENPKTEPYCLNGVCYTGYGEPVYGYRLNKTESGTEVYAILHNLQCSREVIRINDDVFTAPDGRYWYNSPDNFDINCSCATRDYDFAKQQASRML